MTILEATTSDRGDPNYQFEAMVTFDVLSRAYPICVCGSKPEGYAFLPVFQSNDS